MRFYAFLLFIIISSVSFASKKQNSAPGDLRDSLVRYAKTLINKPYRSGSKGPGGFDCSGYTSYVYSRFGIPLNSSSGSQVTNGEQKDVDELKKGDLVFFKGHNSKNSRIGHVGIFIDRNSDGSFNFIHSANGGGVRIDNSSDPYYSKRFVTACAVLPTDKQSLKYTPTSKSNPHTDIQYASTGKIHRVKKGESLYTIAKENKVTEEQIKEWNNLNNSKLKPGQKLNLQPEKPQISTTKTYTVKKGDSFYSIAKKYKISEADLLQANNNNKSIKPGDKILLAGASSSEESPLQDESKTTTSQVTHKIKKGETLSDIAEKYHTTSAKIKQLNKLNGDRLKPGKTLIVGIREENKTAKNLHTDNIETPKNEKNIDISSKSETLRKFHKVKKGETLSEIADKYHTTTTKIKELNNLTNKKLKPGTLLTIQLQEKNETVNNIHQEGIEITKNENKIDQSAKKSVTRKFHKVKKGETLSEIANKYNTTPAKIKELNNLTNKKLKPGKTLIIEIIKATNHTTSADENHNQTTTEDVTKHSKKEIKPESNISTSNTNTPKTKTVTTRKTHKVRKGETLSEIADKYNTTTAKIRQINGLKNNKLQPGKVLTVKITENEIEVVDTKPAEILIKSDKTETGNNTQRHKVRRGETLSSIAETYGVSVAQLKKWNKLKATKVKPGTTLSIPKTERVKTEEPSTAKSNISFAETKAEKSAQANNKTYIVGKKETLYSIAKAHHLSAIDLKEWNNKNDNQVHEGDTLVLDPSLKKRTTTVQPENVHSTNQLSKSDQKTDTTNNHDVRPIVYNQPTDKIDTLTTSYKISKTHIVQEEETLESIAEAYNVTPAQIKQWNGFSRKKNKVAVGDKLRIETTKTEYVIVSAKKKKPAKNKATATPQNNDSTTAQPSVVAATPAQTKYTVKKGETLFLIARATNLTVDQLKEYNRLTTTEVKENQVLSLIPDPTSTKTVVDTKKGHDQKESSVINYIVKPGDTLISIAKAHNISIADLKEANEITGNEVNIGQHLQIPLHQQ